MKREKRLFDLETAKKKRPANELYSIIFYVDNGGKCRYGYAIVNKENPKEYISVEVLTMQGNRFVLDTNNILNVLA